MSWTLGCPVSWLTAQVLWSNALCMYTYTIIITYCLHTVTATVQSTILTNNSWFTCFHASSSASSWSALGAGDLLRPPRPLPLPLPRPRPVPPLPPRPKLPLPPRGVPPLPRLHRGRRQCKHVHITYLTHILEARCMHANLTNNIHVCSTMVQYVSKEVPTTTVA